MLCHEFLLGSEALNNPHENPLAVLLASLKLQQPTQEIREAQYNAEDVYASDVNELWTEKNGFSWNVVVLFLGNHMAEIRCELSVQHLVVVVEQRFSQDAYIRDLPEVEYHLICFDLNRTFGTLKDASAA